MVNTEHTDGTSASSMSVLAMNGGSSSIKFTLYRTRDLLQRRQRGEVERYGFHGLPYSFLME